MTVEATRPVLRWVQTVSLTVAAGASLTVGPASGPAKWWVLVGLMLVTPGLRQVWQRIHLDNHGMTIRYRPGHERLAWGDIARVEVRWLRLSDGDVGLRSAQPVIERTDGRRVQSRVLADLMHDRRRGERHAVGELLAERAAQHGFELVIHGPGAEGTRPD